MNKFLRLLLALFVAGCSIELLASSDKSNVGQALPELKLDYLKDAPDLAGKPLIVEFWATWCGPCLQSIPHLNQIHAKYKDQGLVIIGITNEKSGVVKGFLKKTAMDYIPAIDSSGALGRGFGIKGIPHAMLVDKTGKIVWEGHPIRLSDKQVESLLK